MYRWRKGIASWKVKKTLYLSVPFTWLLLEAEMLAREHRGKVIAGGPAAMLMRDSIDWAEVRDTTEYDALSFYNPCATFTTRGCPNKCKFCAVPIIEGAFRELDHWKPAPIVCDNNLLACSKKHFVRVIDSLLPFERVDFNQGLDAKLFTGWHAEQLKQLKSVMVRFAFDHITAEKRVHDAIQTARNAGLRKFGIYVLMGYKDTPQDARYRLEKVRSWGILPNPMRYQPLNATKKNGHVSPNWMGKELKRMMRYYSRLTWLGHIPFNEYLPETMDLFEGE